MSLKQNLLRATTLGFGLVILATGVASAGPDQVKDNTSGKSEQAVSDTARKSADAARDGLAERLADDKVARLLEALVGEDGWSALDSIALTDPSVQAELANEAGVDTADHEYSVLVTRHVEGAPIHVAVSADTRDVTMTRTAARADTSAKIADIEDAPLGNFLDAMVESPAGEAVVQTVSDEAVEEEWGAEDWDSSTSADVFEPSPADLTSLIAAGDFASFLEMIQGSTVDLIPSGPLQTATLDGSDMSAESGAEKFSGLFIDEGGHIVTVLRDWSELTAFRAVTADDRVLRAEVKAFNPDTGMALLKVSDDQPFRHVILNEEARMAIADLQPIGPSTEPETAPVEAEIIETEVVDTRTDRASAAPTSKPTVEKDAKGYLGVSIQSVSSDMASDFGFDAAKGVLVSTVRAGTAAAKADLRPGDVILAVNGETIAGTDDAVRTIGVLPVGGKADLKVWRDGKTIPVAAVLERRADNSTGERYPAPEVSDGTFEEPVEKAGEDAAAAEASDQEAADQEPTPHETVTAGLAIETWGVTVGAGAEPGVEVLAVRADSEAARKGLKTGDVILRVADKTVTKAEDVQSVVGTAVSVHRPAVLLLVRGPERSSEERFIALKLEGKN